MEVKYSEGSIREYDLSAANASILVEKGYISEDMYYDLIEGDKQHRNKLVGLLIRDNPEVYNILKEGVDSNVELFKRSNKLNDDKILEVSKDAIFTINVKGTAEKRLKLSFGDYINFIPKADYLSCLEFSAKEGSSIFIKLYLVRGSNKVVSRYGKLDVDNPIYDMIVDLMRFIYDGSRNKFMSTLRELVIYVKKGRAEDVCNGCSNDRLIEAFRELATL